MCVQVVLPTFHHLCRCSVREAGRTCSAATVRRSVDAACLACSLPAAVPTLPVVP